MFNKLVVADPNFGNNQTPLDYGALVEAMLFYGHVEVVGQWAAVEQLLRVCGPDGLRALLETGHLHFTYQENWPFIISTDDAATGERLVTAVAMDMRNKGLTPGSYAIDDELKRAHFGVSGQRGASRRFAAAVAPLIHVERVGAPGISRAVADFHDKSYLAFAAREVLADRAPGFRLPEHVEFAIEPARGTMLRLSEVQSDTYIVRSNVDFESAQEQYRRATGSDSPPTPNVVLSQILLARVKLEQAARIGGELSTNAVHSRLIAERIRRSVNVTQRDARDQIAAFNEVLLGDSVAIRDAVNSGRATFAETLQLLEQANKFRDWLRDRPHSSNLLAEYVREVTAGSWAERLPTKVVRWLVVEGAGAWLEAHGFGFTKLAATALGFGDTFILDHLLKGWDPSQFVDEPLKRFASKGISDARRRK